MNRSRPLVRVNSIYDTQWSHYPDRVKVPMDDGKIIEYHIDLKMPEPVLKGLLDRFDRFVLGGYKVNGKYTGKHARRNANDKDSTAED